MQLTHLELNRFKRFKNYHLDFKVESGIPNITLLIGDNGSGKTSILQAIAATLGAATKQIENPSKLEWPGFMVDYLSSNYRGVSEVKLHIQFSQAELEATKEFYKKVIILLYLFLLNLPKNKRLL